MTDYIKNLIEESPTTDSYKYMLLDRMKTDCNYYLGYGNRLKKYLWAKEEKEHIENMKALWNSFPEDKKPEWLTMEEIENYEMQMTILAVPTALNSLLSWERPAEMPGLE